MEIIISHPNETLTQSIKLSKPWYSFITRSKHEFQVKHDKIFVKSVKTDIDYYPLTICLVKYEIEHDEEVDY